MSVVARRRKPRVSGDSEELSEDSYDDAEVNKESEGGADLNASSEGLRESEYETLDETGETESESEGTAAVDEKEELSDSVIIEYEREEGDGQESAPPKEKKLDDDEDRRNPQYIPKRGTFYEHDDRTAVEDTNEEPLEKETDRSKDNEKKKVWKEHENRWSHDRYNEQDQAPKSRDELIAIYGYDIRNEDCAPRARRRRKYGRGPNKYTRNWEDEDAYGKSVTVTVRGGGVGQRGEQGVPKKPLDTQAGDSEEEFPPLNNPSHLGRENKAEGMSPRSNAVVTARGSNRASYRGRRGGGSVTGNTAFPPLPRNTDPESEENDVSSKETNTTPINTGIHSSNVWKKNNSQSKTERIRNREDSLKSTAENVKKVTMNINGNSNNNPTSKTQVISDNKVEVVEENGWKSRRDKMHLKSEDVTLRDANSDWRNKNKGDRRNMQGFSVESQTFTPSAPRGRGRVRRQGGLSRQNVEFQTNSAPRRSHSETRVPAREKVNAAEGPVIKTQIVNRTTDDVTRELHHVSISEHKATPNNRDYSKKPIKNNSSNYHQVPPRMQENASNKPKRYSSQRQRSLPETGAGAYAQPHGYYPPAGYAQPTEELEGMAVVSSGYVQPPPVYGDSQQQPAPPTVVAPQPQLQPATSTPPLGLLPPPHPQAAAYAAPPFPSPPTFISSPVAGPPPRLLPPGPATYMAAAPSGAPIINYVPSPAQNQFPPQAYAPFQGYTAVPATRPPPELYPPQGITYYSPEEQVVPRTITHKRQSTAIPIVPPPDKGPRGRGRLREDSNEIPPAVIDQGGSGDASNIEIKEAQMEDAQEQEKEEPTVMEGGDHIPRAIESISSIPDELSPESVSHKIVVSAEIIDAINITEIPESEDALEAAKCIKAAEDAETISGISSNADNCDTTMTSSISPKETSAAPANSVELTVEEQEVPSVI